MRWGSGSGDDKDEIDGADKKTATPSPSTSATNEGVDRPKISLPKDVNLVFEWPKTGNSDKDAVLHDAEEYLRALNQAKAKGDVDDKAYRFYSEGQPLVTPTTRSKPTWTAAGSPPEQIASTGPKSPYPPTAPPA
ncbi:hypothetical protein NKH77_23300 [Streptomyces sp. M19]